MAMPTGYLKLDTLVRPSAEPAVPVPANVVKTPAAVILKTLLLLASVTYTLPLPSATTPQGLLKYGESVDTRPPDVIFRILPFPLSAT